MKNLHVSQENFYFFFKIFDIIFLDSYIALTAMAIQQSPEKMLPLSDIYKVGKKKFFFCNKFCVI
jgi:hypothetical protein